MSNELEALRAKHLEEIAALETKLRVSSVLVAAGIDPPRSVHLFGHKCYAHWGSDFSSDQSSKFTLEGARALYAQFRAAESDGHLTLPTLAVWKDYATSWHPAPINGMSKRPGANAEGEYAIALVQELSASVAHRCTVEWYARFESPAAEVVWMKVAVSIGHNLPHKARSYVTYARKHYTPIGEDKRIGYSTGTPDGLHLVQLFAEPFHLFDVLQSMQASNPAA